jgi:2-phosphinomethylmalic acid synthase
VDIRALRRAEAALSRPLELSFTKDSGLAGLIFLIKQRAGLVFAKDDPRLHAIHEELLRQFDAGRQTAVEWEEIEELLRAPAPA